MINKNKEEKKIDYSYKKFIKASSPGLDGVSIILRSHLLAEYYIDHIIVLKLPRGDLLVDRKFSFIQKLCVIEALEVLKKETTDSIKALNSVRNRCAHDLDYKITESDVDSIGRPFGKKYIETKKEHFSSVKELLHWTLATPIIDLEIVTD